MKYYLTQAGALFLEDSEKYPNMILRDGEWIVKPKKGKGSSKTSQKHPNMILRGGKWIVKPKEGSK